MDRADHRIAYFTVYVGMKFSLAFDRRIGEPRREVADLRRLFFAAEETTE
jgi:hypothetical protein